MTIALTLALALAPAFAAEKPSGPRPDAAGGPQAEVPDKDRQPNPGSQAYVPPYGGQTFEQDSKEHLEMLESNSKEEIGALDASLAAQKDIESRQLKEKFEFLGKQRDERAAFERGVIEDWKKFVEKLKPLSPEERGAERQSFDQKAAERRQRLTEDLLARNKEFLDKQQRDREEFWRKRQAENNERARRQYKKWAKNDGWEKAPSQGGQQEKRR